MANIKITDLDAYTNPDSTDVLPIVDVDADTTKRVTIADLMENAGAGTAGLPGIAFDGDPNTGIYRPAADQIALSTAGVQRLLIDDNGDVTIAGGLEVQGTTTFINTTNLQVEDKNIELGKVGTPSDTTADGGGITLLGTTNHTINWSNSGDSWDFSEHVNIASGKEFKINGTSVLTNNTLGSGVTASSLTSVGTITTGVWNGTPLTSDYIGTAAITTAKVADDAINADKLANTTVTAGSYTAADITVDQQGRITAAANGTLSNAEIADGAISTSKIADDAVNADKLANTAVTAGSYTAADITVDAQGRITAASSGSVAVTFPIDGGDNDKIRLGASQDLQIFHDGNSVIEDTGAGALVLKSDSSVNVVSGTTFMAQFTALGAADLYHNNSKKLATTSTGIDVTGTAVTDGVTSSARIIIGQTDTTGTDGEADDLIVANNTSNAGITVRSSSSANASLYFADQDAVRQGRIEYNHTSDYMRFNTAGTEVLRIDSSGRVGIGVPSPGSYNADAADLVIGSSGSNGLTIVSGTASNGNIFFADGTSGNDQLRGFIQYNHQLNFFNIGTNATSAIRIDSSQRVGIGTTSPSNLLHVGSVVGDGIAIGATVAGTLTRETEGLRLTATSTTRNISFVTSGTEAMRVDTSGRLLVGTSSASNQNNGGGASAREAKAYIFNANATTTERYSLAINSGSANSNGATLNLSKTRATTDTHTVVQSGDTLGEIRFQGSDGTYFVQGARISALVDGTPGSQDMPGRLVFSTTADGASSPTERLRIASTGAFGLSGANYGTSGQVLTSQGSGSAPQWATPAGSNILQIVAAKSNTQSTFGNVIPFDNTEPTSSEGVQIQQITITPKSNSSNLLVEWACGMASATGGSETIQFGMWADSSTNPSQMSQHMVYPTDHSTNVMLRVTIPNTQTSTRTMRIRAGVPSGATGAVNRRVGGNYYNAATYMVFTVIEYTT